MPVERCEIEYIYALRRFGMKLDLEIMRNFIELLGNPHESLHFAHIAGTNGKGSVASYLYNIMRRNYSTGLYTSPHIERFTERIVVDGEEIDEDYIVDFVHRYRGVIEELSNEQRNPTFFEVTTALALKYFYEKEVDFAVMEVGLGGRLDATNIINPDITAITSIDREHTNVLGKTIPKIAREKAGIIKKGIPVVVGEHKKAANSVIERIALKRGAEYHNALDECTYTVEKEDLNGMKISIATPVRAYKIRSKMLGTYQIKNMAVAIRMAELLSETYTISRGDIEKGIENTVWRGRFEIKSRKPLLIFDAAHNPAGARVLAKTLRELKLKNITLLFSMLDDKDVSLFLRYFKRLADKIVLTEIDYYRRMPVSQLRKYAEQYFNDIYVEKNYCNALRLAMENDMVLATGSIYLLGGLERCVQSLQ